MLNKNDANLLEEINKELDKPIESIDTELIENNLNGIQQNIIIDNQNVHKMADKIIKEHKKLENEQKQTRYPIKKRIITAVAAAIILTTCLVTVSAHKSTIIEGLRWLGDKLHICTTNANNAMNESAKQYFNSNEYVLPSGLTDIFSVSNISENKRNECSDTCIEMINNSYYINIIITTVYDENNLKDIEAPSKNMKPEEQFVVNDITISTFNLDGIYTAYYAVGNKTYQLTSNMDYDDFCEIIRNIKK